MDDGILKGKLEDARNFLAKGVSILLVAECTGISLDKLEEIKREL